MAKNNAQKVLMNLLRIAVEKEYEIEIRSNKNYKTQLGPTKDYEYVRNNYRKYSNATVIFTDSATKKICGRYWYNISENKIQLNMYIGEGDVSLLSEAQFLTDIGY